jgi:copper resistance protein B
MKMIIFLALTTSATPALAQTTDHTMHHAGSTQSAPLVQPSPEGRAMPGMDMPVPTQGARSEDAPSAEPTGTDQPPGSAEPPPLAHDQPAGRYWDPAAMAAAEMAQMHPPKLGYAKLTFDLAEYQFREGRDGYRWEGEAWFGDLDRFVIKSKGDGTHDEGLDQAEVQVLYAKALDPWWNLQVGLRQDIRPRPARTWATLGIEGRAPYQFEVQTAVFLSDKGQLAARIEGAYDLQITQRLILQPRAEFDLSAQDMPDQRIGSGLSTAELGLRLHYEIRREFAPYVGINWTWATGKTADYARADGKDTTERSVVAGIRFWL